MIDIHHKFTEKELEELDKKWNGCENMNKIPIEYYFRPLTVGSHTLTPEELAIVGRIVLVASSQKVEITRSFLKDIVEKLFLIYLNPDNVDFIEREDE